MLILIYGDDGFRAQEKMIQMKDAFLEKFDPSGMNVAQFPNKDSAKIEIADALQSICSYPFLGSKRMVIITGLFDQLKKGDETLWLEGFSRMPETTIVLLVEFGPTASLEKKKLFKEIAALGEVHKYTFPKLEGAALTKWVTQRIAARGAMIEPAALSELVVRVGPDLWQMHQEIEKLIAYANHTRISSSMVDELVRASFESKIFELMDALSKKQRERTLTLLEQERLAGSDDHYLLTMLGRQIRILIGVRACLDEHPRTSKQEIAARIDVHPFVAQKALEQARLFSFEDLKRAHEMLFQFDRDLKSGRINAMLATDLIADSLLR